MIGKSGDNLDGPQSKAGLTLLLCSSVSLPTCVASVKAFNLFVSAFLMGQHRLIAWSSSQTSCQD